MLEKFESIKSIYAKSNELRYHIENKSDAVQGKGNPQVSVLFQAEHLFACYSACFFFFTKLYDVEFSWHSSIIPVIISRSGHFNIIALSNLN